MPGIVCSSRRHKTEIVIIVYTLPFVEEDEDDEDEDDDDEDDDSSSIAREIELFSYFYVMGALSVSYSLLKYSLNGGP